MGSLRLFSDSTLAKHLLARQGCGFARVCVTKCSAGGYCAVRYFAIASAAIGFWLAVMAGQPACAQEQPETQTPKPVSARDVYAPSGLPDRIMLTWSGDPATTQSVTWRTDNQVAAKVEFAIAEDGPKFVRNLQSVDAESSVLEANRTQAYYHTVQLTGLEPETTYAYRVGDGVNWSEFSHFTTASREAKPFSFIYFGDAQNDIKSHWSRVVRQAYRQAPAASFMLHAGDLVNVPNNDNEWGQWFYSGGWIFRTLPSLATPGNHEYARGELSGHWRPVFSFPDHGPEGLEETVYWMDYQGVRFISLNSNERLEDQLEWFEQAVESSDAKWHIVTMHHPVYSTAKNRDNAGLRNALQPLFDKHGIDLVLQGHDHTYGRTGLEFFNEDAEDPQVQAALEVLRSSRASSRARMDQWWNETEPNAVSSSTDERFESTAANELNAMTGLRRQEKPGGTYTLSRSAGPKCTRPMGMTCLKRWSKTHSFTKSYRSTEIGCGTRPIRPRGSSLIPLNCSRKPKATNWSKVRQSNLAVGTSSAKLARIAHNLYL